jgi:hypothetical protein
MATPTATVRDNILHDFVNYAYNLQLWSVTKKDFNRIAQGSVGVGSEDSILTSGELLISNGGFSKDDNRSPSFGVDFGIDNLEVESLVGNKGPGARGTDALSLKFDIIEPYTVTFLNRLTDVAQRSDIGQDFKTLIYCLKIQFFGYDSMGKIAKIDATKYIPFTLLNIQFTITNKGAIYQCQGIPAQNLVMSFLDNTIPAHVELLANDVKGIFGGTIIGASTGSGANPRSDTTTAATTSNSTATPKDLASFLNTNEQFKKDKGKLQDIPNQYAFEFVPELGNAKTFDPTTASTNSRPMASPKGSAGAQNAQAGRSGQIEQDTQNGTWKIQAGTRVTDFINKVMEQTDYMKNQVKPAADKSQPIKAWKIIPKMEILGYDTKTNFYARKTTYSVVTYDHYGEDHPNLGQAPVSASSVVKKYEYIYTGNNRDVIKANLEFKMAFFETRNGTAPIYTDPDQTNVAPASVSDGNVTDNRIQSKPGILVTNGLANMQNSGDTTGDEKSIVIAGAVSKLLDNAGDMITLDLEIVGDPDWLQQDNVLYSTNVDSSSKTLSNGTINFQNSTTCFYFTFKTPVDKDYDKVTGMFNLTDATTSNFSGYYQVINVTSSFRKGRFTQKLNNFRVRIQDTKDTTDKQAVQDGGTTTTATPAVSTP